MRSRRPRRGSGPAATPRNRDFAGRRGLARRCARGGRRARATTRRPPAASSSRCRPTRPRSSRRASTAEGLFLARIGRVEEGAGWRFADGGGRRRPRTRAGPRVHVSPATFAWLAYAALAALFLIVVSGRDRAADRLRARLRELAALWRHASFRRRTTTRSSSSGTASSASPSGSTTLVAAVAAFRVPGSRAGSSGARSRSRSPCSRRGSWAGSPCSSSCTRSSSWATSCSRSSPSRSRSSSSSGRATSRAERRPEQPLALELARPRARARARSRSSSPGRSSPPRGRTRAARTSSASGTSIEAVHIHIGATAVFGVAFLALARRSCSPSVARARVELLLAGAVLGAPPRPDGVGEVQWREALPWGLVLVHVTLATAVWGRRRGAGRPRPAQAARPACP